MTEHSTIGEVSVEVPGEMIARYRDGKITGWVFLPSASYAGYFGPAAVVTHCEDGDDEDLDVESTEGPFWIAVQEALAEKNPFEVEWTE